MTAYYNEHDSYAAQWIRNLMAAGLIMQGEVDERSITEVQPEDLRGFTRVHLFAGIGVWDYALQLAGWPAGRPVWTGSCPCPPFSSAGKKQRCTACGGQRHLCHPRRTGYFVCLDCGCSRDADPRHLWPEFSRLVRECRPSEIFGEQVASKDGRLWLDVVSADLQNAHYGSVGADLCAAGIGAPHIRQRLWFYAYDTRSAAGGVGDGLEPGLEGHGRHVDDGDEPGRLDAGEAGSVAAAGAARRLADGTSHGRGQERPNGGGLGSGDRTEGLAAGLEPGRDAGGMDQSQSERHGPDDMEPIAGRGQRATGPADGALADQPRPARPTDGYWRDADWLFCRDGRWRPVEPGTFPLAHGVANRVGQLRAYGNSIVAPLAAEFIAAVMDCRP